MLEIIKQIIQFSPRQFEGEKATGEFILKKIQELGVDFKVQEFKIKLPYYPKFFLLGDNKKIDAQPCSLKSGWIRDKKNLYNVLLKEELEIDQSNINFNPLCPAISLSDFYFAPAFAVSHSGLREILKAKKIKGYVQVEKRSHLSANILVGNFNNPKNIIFAHYDSIEKGAIDNASGVAVSLCIILKYPEVVKKNLIVFSGCEELSFDYPTYWGFGFRIFEKNFLSLMKNSQKIIVIDSVGASKPNIKKGDLEMIEEAYPIKNIKKFAHKIFTVTGDLEELMKVYHSELDNGKNLKEKYLELTLAQVKKLIS